MWNYLWGNYALLSCWNRIPIEERISSRRLKFKPIQSLLHWPTTTVNDREWRTTITTGPLLLRIDSGRLPSTYNSISTASGIYPQEVLCSPALPRIRILFVCYYCLVVAKRKTNPFGSLPHSSLFIFTDRRRYGISMKGSKKGMTLVRHCRRTPLLFARKRFVIVVLVR